MAKTKTPHILSGRIGNLVYRNVDGEQVVSELGRQRKRGKPTPQHIAFAQANVYRKSILADPWRRRAYQRLGERTARRFDQILVSDFLTPPKIEEIDVSGYTGAAGGEIVIFAIDDVQVVSVEVQVHSVEGREIERGPAVERHGVWYYAPRIESPTKAMVFTATAKDRPGHAASGRAVWLPAAQV